MTYAEEELLEELERVSEEHCGGEAPRVKDMRENGKIAPPTIYQRFGSWEKALERVGFSPNHRLNIPGEEIKEDLKRVSREHCDGKTPTTHDMDSFGQISKSTLIRHFGSWNKALEECGFEPNVEMNISEEELLEEIRRVSEECCGGRAPRLKDMNKYGKFSKGPFLSLFDSWNNSLEHAGFSPNLQLYISRKELGEELERVSKKHCDGGPPRIKDMDEFGKFTGSGISRRFSSWNSALREFGFEPDTRVWNRHSKEALLEEVRWVSEEFCGGDAPYAKDMDRFGQFSTSTYGRRFDSWNDVLKEAGYETRHQSGWVPSGEESPHWKGGGVEDYGVRWEEVREKVLERDSECRVCGENPERKSPDVHHIRPVRLWDEGEYREMNALDNLICLCSSCHRSLEGKWQDVSPEEFARKGREYLGYEKESVFDY